MHSEKKGEHFLINSPGITIILLIMIVLLGQFWFQGFLELSDLLWKGQLPWYMHFLIATIITVIFYILIVYVLKIPITLLI